MAIPNETLLQALSVAGSSRRPTKAIYVVYTRVVAIDQRGYGLSSKPDRVADYRVDVLARDIADVIEQLGELMASDMLCIEYYISRLSIVYLGRS